MNRAIKLYGNLVKALGIIIGIGLFIIALLNNCSIWIATGLACGGFAATLFASDKKRS